MNDRVFLGTNILVYASLKEKESLSKRERSVALLSVPDKEFIFSIQEG